MEINPCFPKNLLHLSRFGIISQRSHEPGLNTQARQIRGDVAGASGSETLGLNLDQGDRGFVGNAQGTAFEIAIQDEIADDEQFNAEETADDFGKPVFVDVQPNLFLHAAT